MKISPKDAKEMARRPIHWVGIMVYRALKECLRLYLYICTMTFVPIYRTNFRHLEAGSCIYSLIIWPLYTLLTDIRIFYRPSYNLSSFHELFMGQNCNPKVQ